MYHCVLLVLLNLSLDVYGSVSQAEINRHLDLGRDFLARGQLQDALTHYHAAVDGDPSNYLTYYKRGTVYLALGKSKVALQDFEKVLELKPDFTAARVQRANVLLKQASFNDAENEFNTVLQVEPNNEDAMISLYKISPAREDYQLAKSMVSSGQYDQAIYLLTRVIEVSPWAPELRELRSECHVAMGDYMSAVSDIRSSTKLLTDNTIGFYKLAMMLYRLGSVEESLREIRECLKLDPEHKECFPRYKTIKKVSKRMSEATEAEELHDFNNCISSAKGILELEPNIDNVKFTAYHLLCKCYASTGEISLAIENCQEAVKIRKEPSVLCDSAEAYLADEMYDVAMKELKEAMEMDPSSQRAKELLQKAQQRQKLSETRDYYKILGVPRTATKQQIIKAYRKAAHKWHPDNFQDGIEKKKAENKFIDIAAAKEVLTDEEKRAKFDRGEDPLDPESVISRNNSDGNGLEGECNVEFRTYPADMFISCSDLFEMIQNYGRCGQVKPYLILDIRKRESWDESRIKVTRCVNIEPHWINTEIMGYEFENLIKDAQRIDEYRLYLDRNHRHLDCIVLMDWNTTTATLTPKNTLFVYNIILTKKDWGEFPPPIVILKGGYREWLKTHPQLTTNPNMVPPSNLQASDITLPIYFPDFMNLMSGVFDFILKRFLPIRRPTSSPTESPPRHPDAEYTLQLLQRITKNLEQSIELEKKVLKMEEEILEKINRRKKFDAYNAKMKAIEDRIKTLRNNVEIMETELSSRNLQDNWNPEDKHEKLMFDAEINKYKKRLQQLEMEQARLGRTIEEKLKWSKILKTRPLHRSQSTYATKDTDLSQPMNLPSHSSSQPDVSQHSQQSIDQVDPMETDEQITFSPASLEQEERPGRINTNDPFAIVSGSRAPGTTGLENPHNLCYANSIVQCLSHIAPFRDFFLSSDETMSGDLSQIMTLIMKNLWTGNVVSMTIEPLKNKLAETKKNFNNTDQQDCQEFLVYLFELLHDELKKDDENMLESQSSPDVAMNRIWNGKSSIISKCFYGQTRFNITCNNCGNQSKSNFEVFSTCLVHLPIGKCDLNQCIRDLLNEQESDRECLNCRNKHTMQILEFAYLPKIVIIHLNRFTKERNKNCVEVNISIELEMIVVTSSGRNKHHYVLQGISCHRGSDSHNGHYVSYCKNLADNEWYYYNDKTVTMLKEHEVLENKKEFYLLFYSKI